MPHFTKRISLFSCKIPHKYITNLIARVSSCCYFVDRSPLSPDRTKLFTVSGVNKIIILQSTAGILFLKASAYQNILVYRIYDTQSSRSPQFSRPNNLASRTARATKSSSFARSQGAKDANDVTPKTYQNITVYGEVRTFFVHPNTLKSLTKLFKYQESKKQGRADVSWWKA